MDESEVRYEIEAVVTVDARGQVVLPKEVREALSLEAGSKLAVVIKHAHGAPCCVNLVPTNSLQEGLRVILDSGSTARRK